MREEAVRAFELDPATGHRTVKASTLVSLPILQSIHVEVLRLHDSVNITREVIAKTTTVAGYELPKNALVQAPTRIAHLDEATWATDGHAASEFWAMRNIVYSEKANEDAMISRTPEFSPKRRPSQFFPYGEVTARPVQYNAIQLTQPISGGGVSICPGRHFAKQEIMLTLAMLVTRFDVEFVEWTSRDRTTKSDRPAQDDLRYSGSAAMPPDRDMKVRWRRLW